MIDHAATLAELAFRRLTAEPEPSADGAPRPALLLPSADPENPRSWARFAEDVFRTAAVLAALGVRPGDRVAQFSENRYEWLLLDLAAILNRAVHVPLHATLSGDQALHQIGHSGSRAVFFSGTAHWEKLVPGLGELPAVGYEAEAVKGSGGRAALFAERLAAADFEIGRRLAEEAATATRPEDTATLLYTSGTTGKPKGVVLTHGNLASNALTTVHTFGIRADEVRLNLLPLSHIFARTCDEYTWLAAGSTMALAGSRETVLADCTLVRPTTLNGVPFFFSRVRDGLRQAGRAETPGAVRAMLGGRIDYCVSGGAALPDSLFDFFLEQGVPVLQGYGLSETSPVISMSTREHYRRGSVGRLLPGVEVKIAEDGEILTRGPHVMPGYWQDTAATEEIMEEGWLKTGDLGRLDAEGYLYITGRKKELIVGSTGKNVAPVQLENLLCEDPLLAQALVVGDGRDCLGALLLPAPGALAALAAKLGLEGVPAEELPRHAAVLAVFQEVVTRRLAGLAHYEQVRRIRLIGEPFSIETGELTAKLSMRREVIAARRAAEIEALYA